MFKLKVSLQPQEVENVMINMFHIYGMHSACVRSDGRYYEIVKANFERADRLTVVRTTTCCRVSSYYLLANYKDLIFN